MKGRAGSDRSLDEWDRLRERLARAAAAMRQASDPTEEDDRRTLEERARALATPQGVADGPAGDELLLWSVMGQRFALETCYVKEVARVRDLTPVPTAPAYLEGICNVRGAIMPAFDLRKLMGAAPPGLADRAYMIVVGGSAAEFAILADSVDEVVRLPLDSMFAEHPASIPPYVRGITPDALLVFEGAALLSERALFVGRQD